MSKINWNFDNTYSNLSDIFKENIDPIPVKNPELILFNHELADSLNLDFSKNNKKNCLKFFLETCYLMVAIPLLKHMQVTNLDILRC